MGSSRESPEWDQREIKSFDWADRWNGRFVRALGIGLPLWLWLLLVLGWSGLDPGIGFALASLASMAVVIILEATAFRHAGARWNDRLVGRGLLAFLAATVVIPWVVAVSGLNTSISAVIVLAATLVLGPALAILATRGRDAA